VAIFRPRPKTWVVTAAFTALALGARAVLIVRPNAYALGLAGEEGVRHVSRALRQNFELTPCGRTSS